MAVSSAAGWLISDLRFAVCCYRSLVYPGMAPLEHNFRYPRIREHLYMGGAIALGGRPRTFWHPPCTNAPDISLLYHAPKLEPTVHFASAPQTAPKQQNSPSTVPLNVTDLANADATTLTPVCFGHHGATQSVPMLVGELSVTFLVTPHTLFGGLASNARPMGVG